MLPATARMVKREAGGGPDHIHNAEMLPSIFSCGSSDTSRADAPPTHRHAEGMWRQHSLHVTHPVGVIVQL